MMIVPLAALAAVVALAVRAQKAHPGAASGLLKGDDFDHIPGAYANAGDIGDGVIMRVRGKEYRGTITNWDSSDGANWTDVRIDSGDPVNVGNTVRLARDQMIDAVPTGLSGVVADAQAMPMGTKLAAAAAIAAVGAFALYGGGMKGARR